LAVVTPALVLGEALAVLLTLICIQAGRSFALVCVCVSGKGGGIDESLTFPYHFFFLYPRRWSCISAHIYVHHALIPERRRLESAVGESVKCVPMQCEQG
jgi:hypothetical protein